MIDPEDDPRYQLCRVCGAKDCGCTANDLKNFLMGAASRDAEVAELHKRLGRLQRNANNWVLAEANEAINERDQLRDELAAAIAACKMKDEAISTTIATHDEILPIMNSYMRSLGVTKEWEETCAASDKLREALTIKPDDTALRAWLGEPVGEVEVIDIDEDAQPSGWFRMYAGLELGEQLYSPKGLT